MSRTFFQRQLMAVLAAVSLIQLHAGEAIAQTQAQRMSDAAAAAKIFGESQKLENLDSLFKIDQGTGDITFNPGQRESKFGIGELFPGATVDSSADLQSLYGNDAALTRAGEAAQKRLETEPSVSGEAYRMITDSKARMRPDLRNDPIFWQVDELNADPGRLSTVFGACKTQHSYRDSARQVHMPDYRTCERVKDVSGSAVLRHDYSAGVVRHVDGPMNLASCGDGCMELWIGRVGDNYWSGSCAVFEQETVVEVINPDAVLSATLDYVKYDDYMQVWLGEDKIWSGPHGDAFPPETAGSCELGTSWQQNPGLDVSTHFKTSQVLSFKIRVSVTGGGEGYGRIRILYDPQRAVLRDEWYPPSAVTAARAAGDGFCAATTTCTRMPDLVDYGPDADGDGQPDGPVCAEIAGVRVCENQLSTSPAPGLSAMCMEASVESSCGFWRGPMECWTDPQGVEHCPVIDGEPVSSCAELEANPSCGIISSECVSGAEGASGTCYVQTETWDCGYEREIPTIETETGYSCAGSMVMCGDKPCVTTTYEQSPAFEEAAAALYAARFMAMDGQCTPSDGLNNVTCDIFNGDPLECKKAVGGVVDCCVRPDGVSIADYLTMLFQMGKLANATGVLDASEGIRGAWETLTKPIDTAWTELQKPFVQAWQSVTGGTEAAASEAMSEGILTTVQQELMKETAKFIAQAFGDAAANSLFSVGGQQLFKDGLMKPGEIQLGGGEAFVGTALSWVMTAYTIYTVTMLLIQIIWACEQSEFELGAKRQLKSCHYVGSYCKTKVLGQCIEKREAHCCFASPLSRIIQEQIRPQLGMSWGTGENPQCGGIPAERLEEVDWSKVDLSEWMGILSETGHLPTADAMTADRLTGSGSYLSVGDRLNTLDRLKERWTEMDADAVRRKIESELR
jgi:conjugal transfer mating pair stabilization protein TraN